MSTARRATYKSADTPNMDEVICPNCAHQFRAIPQNVQAENASLREELATRDALYKEQVRRAEQAEARALEYKTEHAALLGTSQWQEVEIADLRDDVKRHMKIASECEERALAAEKDAGRYTDKWTHSCNALCMEIDLWIKNCPHCGKPSVDAAIAGAKHEG